MFRLSAPIAATLVLLLPVAVSASELTPRVLAPSAYSPTSPLVATNGRNFMRLFRMNGLTYASATSLDGQAVTAAKAVSDQSFTALAGAGDGYLAAMSAGSEIRLLRLSENGTPVLQRTIPNPALAYDIKLVSSGGNLLLTETVPLGGVEGRLLSADGGVVANLGLIGPPRAFSHAAAAAGNGDFFVAINSSGLTIHRIRGTAVEQIYSAPFTFTAIDLAVRGDTILVKFYFAMMVIANNTTMQTQTVNAETRVVATANGFAFVRPVPETGSSEIVRLDASGQQVDASAIQTVPGSVAVVAVAGNAVEVLTTQRGAVATKLTASLIRTDAPSQAAASDVVSIFPRRQFRLVAASDGRKFLAAFTEQTADTSAASVAPIQRGDGPAPNAGTTLGNTAPSGNAALAGFPRGYLAVWNAPDALLGAFVSPDGFTEPAFTIVSKAGLQDPAVAWNGTSFLVAWSTSTRIFGVALSAEGSVGEPHQISPEPAAAADQYNLYVSPAVAWDGSRFIVSWLTHPPVTVCVLPCFPIPPNGVLVERVSAEAAPLDVQPFPAVASANTPIDGAPIASAGDGTALLAIKYFDRLEVTRVHDGIADPPRKVFEWPYWQGVPRLAASVAFGGGAYTLAWRFGDALQSFITTATLPAAGGVTPLAPRSMNVGAGENDVNLWYGSVLDLSAAASSSGEVVVAASEAARADAARAHGYFVSDMTPAPDPPPAPSHLSADSVGGSVTVTWSAVPGAQGFAVIGDYAGQPLAYAPAGATSVTISSAYRSFVSVRAYNAGGISPPSAAVRVVVHGRGRAVK